MCRNVVPAKISGLHFLLISFQQLPRLVRGVSVTLHVCHQCKISWTVWEECYEDNKQGSLFLKLSVGFFPSFFIIYQWLMTTWAQTPCETNIVTRNFPTLQIDEDWLTGKFNSWPKHKRSWDPGSCKGHTGCLTTDLYASYSCFLLA